MGPGTILNHRRKFLQIHFISQYYMDKVFSSSPKIEFKALANRYNEQPMYTQA